MTSILILSPVDPSGGLFRVWGPHLYLPAMPEHPRRIPPPWRIEELNDACFVVSDANGQKLAYVYFEE